MTESRILWLIVGVFVGWLVWGDLKRQQVTASINADLSTVNPNPMQQSSVLAVQSGPLPPSCGMC
jgi:hypothetical protein